MYNICASFAECPFLGTFPGRETRGSKRPELRKTYVDVALFVFGVLLSCHLPRQVLQDAEKYVDERVASIKSVALNYIAKERALTPEPPKRQNPPSTLNGVNTRILTDGQKGLSELLKPKQDEGMYDEIQITLALDFKDSVGREQSIRASIQRDIAYAIGGDPHKIWVGPLRGGSIVAEIRLEKGFVPDDRTFSDLLDDLQTQLHVKESRLMNGNITRHAIKVCRVTYHEAEALTASPISPVSVNSTLGGDLTAWATDEPAYLPASEAAERRLLASSEKDMQLANSEKSTGLSWLAGSSRVARNLFDKLPLGPSSGIKTGVAKDFTFDVETGESASNTPRDILHPEREARASDVVPREERQKRLGMPSNSTRNSWRITASAADAVQPNPTPSVSLVRQSLLLLLGVFRSMSARGVTTWIFPLGYRGLLRPPLHPRL